jgi:hypothetical protein
LEVEEARENLHQGKVFSYQKKDLAVNFLYALYHEGKQVVQGPQRAEGFG